MSEADRLPVPAGLYPVGSDEHYPEERPARSVRVDGFRLDRAPVTNRRFAAFVAATGYVTEAERSDPAGGAVFSPTEGPVDLRRPALWWRFVERASWQAPEGPGSSITDRLDHPVVLVTRADAEAFCAHVGGRLPTEAEWESAARLGSREPGGPGDGVPMRNGVLLANVWTGAFPYWFDGSARPEAAKRRGTSPVGAFPPSGPGFVDLIGNVWEWTASPYRAAPAGGCCGAGPASGTLVALKGGSHLCAAEYCARYRPAARIGLPPDTATGHVGFRCAY